MTFPTLALTHMEGDSCFLHPSIAFQSTGLHTCSSGLPDRVRWVKADFTCNLKPGLVSIFSHPCIFCLVSSGGWILHPLLIGEFLVPVLVSDRPELGTTSPNPSLNSRCSSVLHLFSELSHHAEQVEAGESSCSYLMQLLSLQLLKGGVKLWHSVQPDHSPHFPLY